MNYWGGSSPDSHRGVRFRSQIIPCGICGGKRGTGAGFSPSTHFGLPCQYHSTKPPYSPSSTCSSYQEEEGAKTGNLPKSKDVTGIGEIWMEKYCHIVLGELIWNVGETSGNRGIDGCHVAEIANVLGISCTSRLLTMTSPRCLETSGTEYPVTQLLIPEELIRHAHRCEYLTTGVCTADRLV